MVNLFCNKKSPNNVIILLHYLEIDTIAVFFNLRLTTLISFHYHTFQVTNIKKTLYM